MLSIMYVMVRSAEGASRTTHGGRAAPGFRFETNSLTRSKAGTHSPTNSNVSSVSNNVPLRTGSYAGDIDPGLRACEEMPPCVIPGRRHRPRARNL